MDPSVSHKTADRLKQPDPASDDTSLSASVPEEHTRGEGLQMPTPGDNLLVEFNALRAAGDELAAGKVFKAIVKEMLPAFRAITAGAFRNRADGEDAIQEILLQIHRKADMYRPERGSYQGFIGTMARNRVTDIVRSNSRRAALVSLGHGSEEGKIPEAVLPDPGAQESSEIVEQREEWDRLKELVQKLPSDKRDVIMLRDIYALSYKEISELLDIPLGTVKSRLSLARRELRQLYLEEYTDRSQSAPLPDDSVATADIATPTPLADIRGSLCRMILHGMDSSGKLEPISTTRIVDPKLFRSASQSGEPGLLFSLSLSANNRVARFVSSLSRQNINTDLRCSSSLATDLRNISLLANIGESNRQLDHSFGRFEGEPQALLQSAYQEDSPRGGRYSKLRKAFAENCVLKMSQKLFLFSGGKTPTDYHLALALAISPNLGGMTGPAYKDALLYMGRRYRNADTREREVLPWIGNPDNVYKAVIWGEQQGDLFRGITELFFEKPGRMYTTQEIRNELDLTTADKSALSGAIQLLSLARIVRMHPGPTGAKGRPQVAWSSRHTAPIKREVKNPELTILEGLCAAGGSVEARLLYFDLGTPTRQRSGNPEAHFRKDTISLAANRLVAKGLIEKKLVDNNGIRGDHRAVYTLTDLGRKLFLSYHKTPAGAPLPENSATEELRKRLVEDRDNWHTATLPPSKTDSTCLDAM